MTKRNHLGKWIISMALMTQLFAPHALSDSNKELTVLSTRKLPLVAPVFQKYTELTGININVIKVSKEQMVDAFRQGNARSTDIYLANDMATLYQGEQLKAFQPLMSESLQQDVPDHLRSKKALWFASTSRARAIIYNPDKVNTSQLLSYATLSSPQWRGKLCLRDGNNPYNLFLVSSLIDRYGEKNTRLILKGWKENLAIPVTKKDTHAIQAVADGRCEVTIANHYYFTRLQAKTPELKAAIFWPDQKGKGVHIGLSGIALAKNSPHPKQAQALMEWMSSKEGQKWLTDFNDEFPVNPRVLNSKASALLGAFKKDDLPLDNLVGDIKTAKRLVAEAGIGL